jgi:probable F420-dependent oxidoreductase
VELGTYGVWTSPRAVGREQLPAAAALAERLGYGTFWLGGSPQLDALRPLLEATERIVVATGIVNVWTVEPEEVAAQFAGLEADHPGRVLVGVGVGHPEATMEYRAPLAVMRAFLDRLDVPRERRCVAALAPRMLELAKERSLGAAPYFTSAEHTSAARAQLGEGPLLAPEVAFVLDEDDDAARTTARGYAESYLRLSNYVHNLLRHGFGEQDVAGAGSDRLIDGVIPHGSARVVAAAVRAHVDAGADHVCVQALGEPGVPERSWTALARELLD